MTLFQQNQTVFSRYQFPLISQEHLTVNAKSFYKAPHKQLLWLRWMSFHLWSSLHLESGGAGDLALGYSPISSLYCPLAHHVPGRMASSSCTFNTFPPQSPHPCCSLYQVCCSPNSSGGRLPLRGAPLQWHFKRGLWGRPKQKLSPCYSLS